MSSWDCRVSGSVKTALNGGGYRGKDDTYVRNESNMQVPSRVEVSAEHSGQRKKVAITTIAAYWKLYYLAEPTEDTVAKTKTVTFVCGTKFSTSNPFTSIMVSDCPIGNRGLNGIYTKLPAAEYRYALTGTSSTSTIDGSITCNWAAKDFSIDVDGKKYELGLFTEMKHNTASITLLNSPIKLELSHQTECKYAHFGTTTKQQTGNSYDFSCYTGSAPRAGASTWSAECQNGNLNIQEPCKPGPTQKYIIVSDFKGSLVPFNGSYLYEEPSGQSGQPGQPGKPVTWKNTNALAFTRIVVSDTASDILELRDTSSSVNYCIKIIPGPPVSLSLWKTTPPPASSPLTVTTDFKATFSTVPDPCELWSTCIGTSTDISKCATEASSCSKAPKASTTSTVPLNIGTPPLVVAMNPLVAGAHHLYGNTADALFVLVPSADGKNAKVLRIPTDTTTANAVTDAVRSTTGWTVASFGTVTNPTPPTPPTPPAETTTEPPCGDLVSCATTATTLSFSSCAAKAVECESTRPKDLVHTDSLTHGDEKGIKLYELTSDVLYGTDAVNAYVVLVRKEKVLVAPRDNKTDAAVLDVAKEGTVWTSKRDNTMMWIIIGSVLGGIAFIVLVVLLLRYSYTDQGYDYDSSYADAVPRPRPRIRRPLLDIESGVATTTTPATTAAAAAQGPKP